MREKVPFSIFGHIRAFLICQTLKMLVVKLDFWLIHHTRFWSYCNQQAANFTCTHQSESHAFMGVRSCWHVKKNWSFSHFMFALAQGLLKHKWSTQLSRFAGVPLPIHMPYQTSLTSMGKFLGSMASILISIQVQCRELDPRCRCIISLICMRQSPQKGDPLLGQETVLNSTNQLSQPHPPWGSGMISSCSKNINKIRSSWQLSIAIPTGLVKFYLWIPGMFL